MLFVLALRGSLRTRLAVKEGVYFVLISTATWRSDNVLVLLRPCIIGRLFILNLHLVLLTHVHIGYFTLETPLLSTFFFLRLHHCVYE